VTERREEDELLGLVDDLMEIADGTPAAVIHVEADGFSVTLRRRPAPRAAEGIAADEAKVSAAGGELLHVRAPTVGIFSVSREWQAGDRVPQGASLGGVQSLGHVADITAPIDAVVREVLAANGAPVEYGQALFSLERA
jgi:biotin carboxyl carrier protein